MRNSASAEQCQQYMTRAGLMDMFQVITQLFEGDQVNVVARGFHADIRSSASHFHAQGYTSFTGFQLKFGLA